MNKIKLLLVIVASLVISASANAQQVKPKFERLQFVTYFAQLTGNKRLIMTSNIINIDQAGQVHYLINFNLARYYLDTTFHASNELTTRLNDIFNGETSLESYRDTSKMPGEYEGPLIFITYTDKKGKTDNISFVEGHMDKMFNGTERQLRMMPYPTQKHSDEIYDDKLLQADIFKYYMSCKYIPKLTHPLPTVRSLEVADPGVKH